MKKLAVVLALSLGGSTARAERTLIVAMDPAISGALAPDLKARGLKLVLADDAFRRFNEYFGVVMPDEHPPSWADDAMKADWAAGTAACRANAGPPPYAGKRKAIFCGHDLAAALWQRYLERIDAKGWFVAAGVTIDKEKGKFSYFASGHEVMGTTSYQHRADAKSEEEALKLAVKAVTQILDSQGAPTERQLVRDLPKAPVGAAPAGAVAAQFRPVAVPPGCAAKLPAKLQVTSTNAQVKMDFEALYLASATGAAAPPRACSLEYSMDSAEALGQTVYRAEGALKCGPDAATSTSRRFMPSISEETALQDLLKQMFAAWCK